ncbi:MAG TPA: hypothetical protein VMS17_20215 [Gemmataceae bacterium]|nr:hypothetical protein [Gemmataceae bacterium]
MALSRCPHCEFLLGPDEARAAACPDCGGALSVAPAQSLPAAAAPHIPSAPPRRQTSAILWAAMFLLALSNIGIWILLLWRTPAASTAASPTIAVADLSRPPAPAGTEYSATPPVLVKPAPEPPAPEASKAPPPAEASPPLVDKTAPDKAKDGGPKAPAAPAVDGGMKPIVQNPAPPAIAAGPMPAVAPPVGGAVGMNPAAPAAPPGGIAVVPMPAAPPPAFPGVAVGPMVPAAGPDPAQLAGRQDPIPLGAVEFPEIEGMRGRIDRNAAGEVVRLRLSGMGILDSDLQLLQPFDNLQELDLDNTPCAGTGLTYLNRLKELRVVNLHGTPASGFGVNDLPSLTSLNLSQTKVTDENLDNLHGLAELRTLDLSGTQIGDAGLERLKGMKQLRELHLAHTNVTDAGVAALQKALPELKISR